VRKEGEVRIDMVVRIDEVGEDREVR